MARDIPYGDIPREEPKGVEDLKREVASAIEEVELINQLVPFLREVERVAALQTTIATLTQWLKKLATATEDEGHFLNPNEASIELAGIKMQLDELCKSAQTVQELEQVLGQGTVAESPN
ncbi:MAG: hypothetical protein UX17_C0053G0001 [Parcubacteria group bacterium GW2011_GWC2_45_7]|nr:MAG: hypothetical protein UX17_C0053G0001 [Parcubacteria group bacterium GW2011_GWC2_45_7]KKU73159.1 MAG: hypothetical protein UX98_C0010G0001 [Parcubacteria group bacterium GW2011_GWA2_47_26]